MKNLLASYLLASNSCARVASNGQMINHWCPAFCPCLLPLLPAPASWFRVLRHGRGHVSPASHFSSAENAATGRVSTLAGDVRRSSGESQSHVAPTLFAGLAIVLACRPIFVALWFSGQHL